MKPYKIKTNYLECRKYFIYNILSLLTKNVKTVILQLKRGLLKHNKQNQNIISLKTMKKLDFEKIEKLYHYTSLKSACKILKTNSLQFGELKKMNDINESYRPIYYSQSLNNDDRRIDKEIAKYRQISLTMDGAYKGFNIPAMWGHYAEKGCGVCLVFDKSKLLPPDSDICHQPITYTDEYNSDIFYDENEDASNFIDKHKNELFFKKTRDWSYEQEYRIIKKFDSPQEPLAHQLDSSLIVVIMYFAKDIEQENSVFNSYGYKALRKLELLAKGKPVVELGRFCNEINLRDNQGNTLWSNQTVEYKNIDCD